MALQIIKRSTTYANINERPSNIHSLKTMASMRIAIDLWKIVDRNFKKQSEFYFAYRKMEYSCQCIKKRVLQMKLPKVIADEITQKMDFRVMLLLCCNYYFQGDCHPAELLEEEFWRNQIVRRKKKQKIA